MLKKSNENTQAPNIQSSQNLKSPPKIPIESTKPDNIVLAQLQKKRLTEIEDIIEAETTKNIEQASMLDNHPRRGTHVSCCLPSKAGPPMVKTKSAKKRKSS